MQQIGQPTRRWAVEAVWIADQEGDPVTFDLVARHIAEVQALDPEEAMGRVFDAVRIGEVEAYLTDSGEWRLRIDPRVGRQVARRHQFWATVRAIVSDDEWNTETYDPDALDEAWRRVKEDE